MTRLLLLLTFVFGLTHCASLYQSEQMQENADIEHKSSQAASAEAKKTYKNYVQAHKHMLKSSQLRNNSRAKKLHKALKQVRVQAKKLILTEKRIQKEKETLKQVLKDKRAISESDPEFKKNYEAFKRYALGTDDPKLQSEKKSFKESVLKYNEVLRRSSGYLADGKLLRKQFQARYNLIRQELSQITNSLNDSKNSKKITQIGAELEQLKVKLEIEIPLKVSHVFLFPEMIAYSIIDRLDSFDEEVDKLGSVDK